MGADVQHARRRACTGCCSAASPARPRSPSGRPCATTTTCSPCSAPSSSWAARRLEQSVVADAPHAAGTGARPTCWRSRAFDRTIDTDWRRTSYSGLIRAEEAGPAVGSEPEATPIEDEPEQFAQEPDVEPGAGADPGLGPSRRVVTPVSPMADLPAGAAFGTLVHAVLEHADPARPTCGPSCSRRSPSSCAGGRSTPAAEAVAEALLPLHDTPLGPLARA